MADPTVMDAVNAALENEGAPNETVDEEIVTGEGEGTEETPEGTDDSEGTAEGAEEGTEDSGTEGDEPSEEPTREELAVEAEKLGISVRDNGKFKSKEQLQKEITDAQAAADKTPKLGKDGKPLVDPKTGKPVVDAKAVKKDADPLNDPIDKSLNVKTQERIRTLIDRTRAAEETAQTNQTNFDTLIRGVQATGTTPEQYGETLSFLQKLNSGDPVKQGEALTEIESLADRLATMLGRERMVSDPLAGHPDLQAAVKGGQLTQKFAQETARLRNGTTMRTTMATDAQNAEQQRVAIETEKQQGKTELNELEATLKGSDPQYAAKLALILPAVRVALSHVRPSQWRQEFQRIYKEARVGAPARPVIPNKGQQPNRANKSGGNGGSGGPANGGGAAPKDMMAAVNAALAKGR